VQQTRLAEMALAGEPEIKMMRKRNLRRDVEEREIGLRFVPYLIRHSMLDLSWRPGLVELET
jgi:hypothetical protein